MKSIKPNVVFILSDQHNAKVMGHKGHANVKTPNLDKMAENGVRFDNAVTQNPICTPSRISWLSGQYCHNHGYYGLSGGNPDGLPTIFGHFRKAGYTTSAVGKIHCPEYWVEDDSDNFHETCKCSIGGRSSKYHSFLAERGKEHLEDHIGLPGFEGRRGTQSMEGCPSQLEFEESQEGWIASETSEFIRNAVREGKPFFVHASLPRPHQCTAPSEPFWSMYDEGDLVLPENVDYEMNEKAPHLRKAADRWRMGEWTLFEPRSFEAGRLRKLHGYLGAVSQVDHAVGQLIDCIEELGIAENTIIIYSADHGDYACEHDIMEKAPGICSDAITRIPMIWQWKGEFKENYCASEIVETVDMATTLCKLCGLDLLETGDGKDICHLLRGETGEVHRVGVTEFAWSKSVRKGKYRYVFYPKEMFANDYPDGFGELYDLEKDPWEMCNLYFDPDYADVVVEMKTELLDWLTTTTRPATVLQISEFETKQGYTRYGHTENFDGKIPYQKLFDIAGTNYL